MSAGPDLTWWTAEGPLERLVAALAEGFCPKCGQRVSHRPPFELDEEDLNPPAVAFAQGGCLTCGTWMRAGHGGSNPDRDWFSVSLVRGDGDLKGCQLTLSLNPPADPDDEDVEDWPDYEEDE